MISQITGRVVAVGENSVTLQVNDIAYEILVPTSVVNNYRKKAGADGNGEAEPDTFYTIQYIEGTSGHGNQFVRLVGFTRLIEKDFFQLYTGVEGVGYKTALKSLTLPIHTIALAIETGDAATLKKLPHIGARTAEKMVATLRGRMQKFALDLKGEPLTTREEIDFKTEVLQVLRQVGYSEAEALALMEKTLRAKPGIGSAEEMIQQIFSMQKKG